MEAKMSDFTPLEKTAGPDQRHTSPEKGGWKQRPAREQSLTGFNALLFSFTLHMKVKNYSPVSIDAYRKQLHMFFDYLEQAGVVDIKRVTREGLADYQQKIAEHRDRKGKGYTVATLGAKIRAVKRFFEYLEASNQLLINPSEKIKEPQKETRLPRIILTEDEVTRILNVPDLGTMRGIRDRTILEVFYSTGIRLKELMDLTLYDCDLQGGLLRVNKGKFAKDRVVPLGKHAVRFLKEYITKVRPHHTKKNKTINNLFVTQVGGPFTRKTLCPVVSHTAKLAGIAKHVTPHTFRHTFATELVKNGADITAVQKMLGHSCLSATYIYTKVAGVEVKKTHKEHHPREKDRAEKETITPDTQGFYHAKPA
jgi:integrase/recombinase XerD